MKFTEQTIFSDRNDTYRITVPNMGTYADFKLTGGGKLLPKHIDELIEDLQAARKLMR